VVGKLDQMARALWLELAFSKDAILEAYLNLAPYGANVEGVGAASWVWFGKPPQDLTQAEALLARRHSAEPARALAVDGATAAPRSRRRARASSAASRFLRRPLPARATSCRTARRTSPTA
jgi:penicillin-binding protein 1C